MGTWSYTRKPKPEDICSAVTPYNKNEGYGRLVHPDAVLIGTRNGRNFVKCPHCGLEFEDA